MPYPTCRQIKEDGCLCQSPALKSQQYCYFHSNHRARRIAMAQARARGKQYWLDLPPLEDMQSVVAALDYVSQALHAGVMEHKTAQLILTALRIASINFRAVKAWNVTSRYENKGRHESVVSCTVQRMHGLPEDLDLDTPPEEAFAEATAKSVASETAVAEPKSKKRRGTGRMKRAAPVSVAQQTQEASPEPVMIETEPGFVDMIRDQPDPVEAMKDYVRSMFGEPTKTSVFGDTPGIRKPSESVADLEVKESLVRAAQVGA